MKPRQIKLLQFITAECQRRRVVRGLFRLASSMGRDYKQAHEDLQTLERKRLVSVRRRGAGSPLIIRARRIRV